MISFTRKSLSYIIGFMFFAFLLFANSSPAFATMTIHGTVTGEDTGAPFSSYWVSVADENKDYVDIGTNYTSTDNGGFEIAGLSDGTYYLRARTDSSAYSYSAYEKITISEGKLTSGNLDLKIGKVQFTGKLSDSTYSSTFESFAVILNKIGSAPWDYETYVSKDGTFKLSALSDGNYWVWVENQKYSTGLLYIKIINSKCVSSYSDLKIKEEGETDTKDKLILKGTVVDGKNHLEWTNSGKAPFVGYNIFRSAAPDFINKTDSITDFMIKDTTYDDTNIENGKTYYYVVLGVFADGSMSWASNEISPAAKKSVIVLQVNNKYMTVNGFKKEVDAGYDTAPQNINGRVLLPVRALVEAMGGTVSWDGASSSVVISYKNNQLNFQIGSTTANINGNPKPMDVPAQIIGGRTFVPVRILIESLGAAPVWDGNTQSVTITYDQ